jgi:hypothetical protein
MTFQLLILPAFFKILKVMKELILKTLFSDDIGFTEARN